jgi:hypothetical protein
MAITEPSPISTGRSTKPQPEAGVFFVWRFAVAIELSVRGGMDAIIADLGRVQREVLDKAIPRALNRT